jgi:DNA polymerase elongation subunit (family B)
MTNLESTSDNELLVLYDKTCTKAEQLHTSQMAMKTILNSLYGAFGNGYFQYFSLENAEAVTLTGQAMIMNIEEKLNTYLNSVMKTEKIDRVIACDTDSAYLALNDVVKAVFADTSPTTAQVINFLDNFAKDRVSPVIQKECLGMFDYLNNKDNFMDMKRESIAEKGIWTAKKRYFMSVWDHEGVRYSKPEISITGIQAVSTSTPSLCRPALKECLNIILLKDEATLQKYVKDFKKKFFAADIEQIAKPTGISDIVKYTDPSGNAIKGASAHLRGAINYNKLIEEHGMIKTHEKIKNDDKIKWIYLKMPNIIQDNIIAFTDKLPKKFNLHKYVDYELQFEKTFLSPLRDITDVIGWNLEEVNNLESLFG